MFSVQEQIVRYLKQQRELYGDAVYIARQEHLRVVSTDMAQVNSDGWEETSTLDDLHQQIHECLNCPLGSTRTNFVFGSGNHNADLMVVGEAPGADEDLQGLPFVGRAGQLLTKILESIGLMRDDVYICNILKCRPPNNRKPLASETDECEPYLVKQIALVKPGFILALGLTSANTLLKNKESMTSLRGRIHDYHGIPTIVTYHPAALLRNPEWKKSTWEDVKYLRSLMTP
ncbi:MAG: uracil-DNA glycosylase [Ignavibacteria bacterium]|nr:uracil-DNA glycosylase [Ignavibacteria bacterium]